MILEDKRSELGRRCSDTFVSLKKTCRKLGVSFRAIHSGTRPRTARPPLARPHAAAGPRDDIASRRSLLTTPFLDRFTRSDRSPPPSLFSTPATPTRASNHGVIETLRSCGFCQTLFRFRPVTHGWIYCGSAAGRLTRGVRCSKLMLSRVSRTGQANTTGQAKQGTGEK